MNAPNELALAAVSRAIRAAGVPGMGDFTVRSIAQAAIKAAAQPGDLIADQKITLAQIKLSQDGENKIADAFAHALDAGAPGLSLDTKRAIIVSAMIRVRHAFAGGAA